RRRPAHRPLGLSGWSRGPRRGQSGSKHVVLDRAAGNDADAGMGRTAGANGSGRRCHYRRRRENPLGAPSSGSVVPGEIAFPPNDFGHGQKRNWGCIVDAELRGSETAPAGRKSKGSKHLCGASGMANRLMRLTRRPSGKGPVMLRIPIAVPISILIIGASQACATKSFVRSSVGDVNDKVDAVGRSLEQTQERTRKNEQRIAEVDEKVQAADQSARSANSVATQAANTARSTGERMEALDKASKRLVYDLVLSEQQGNFMFGRADLPATARASIDGLIRQLKQDPKNMFIEIEGHTDNVGPAAINQKLGLARAEAVQRYLYDQYHIPLHKMSVISYAGEKPVAPNSSKEGRAQNRRVVIRIVA